MSDHVCKFLLLHFPFKFFHDFPISPMPIFVHGTKKTMEFVDVPSWEPMIFPCFDGPHVCPVATFLLIRWRAPGHFHSSAPGQAPGSVAADDGIRSDKKLEHHWLYLVISLLTSYNWELTSYNQLLTGYIWLQLVVTAYFMGYGINISPDHWYILCINTDEWFQTMFVIGDHHAKCLKSAINQRKTKDYGMSPRQFALRSVATSDVAVLIGRRQG